MYVFEICAEGIFVTFPWWLENVKSRSKKALFSNERHFEIWFPNKRTITFFWSKLSKLHKKDPILHVATTFALKQGVIRTNHGPISHPLSVSVWENQVIWPNPGTWRLSKSIHSWCGKCTWWLVVMCKFTPLLAPLEGEIWVPLNIQCWYGKMRLKNLKIGPFYDDCIYEKAVDRPSVPFLFLNKKRYPTSTDIWKNKIKRCIFSE